MRSARCRVCRIVLTVAPVPRDDPIGAGEACPFSGVQVGKGVVMSFRTVIMSGIALAAGVFALPAWAQESSDPIKLTLHDWTGQLISTRIMGEVLKQAG